MSEHLTEFYNEAQYLHICSPLILALRALISKSEEMKKEFMSIEGNLEIVFEIANSAYGNNKLKNIFISGIILMSECGF